MQLELKQTQKQIISQNMRQSVEVLQMSSLELADYINEISVENPLMEIETTDYSEENRNIDKFEWLSSFDEQNKAYHRYDMDSDSMDRICNLHADDRNELAEYLHFQLLEKRFSHKDMEILDFICLSLDSKGYYTEPPGVLCCCFNIELSKEKEYIQTIKELEPTGVAASSLQECLLLQLEEIERREGIELKLERDIVNNHIGFLGKNQLHVIAKRLGIKLEDVKCACERIRSLNPIPSRGFNRDVLLKYIEPDIMIIRRGDRFSILLNNETYPKFSINGYYKNILDKDIDKDARLYIKNKLRQIENLQEAVTRRNKTLQCLAQCILERHMDFFAGKSTELSSLHMHEAAEILGVHESTISRAVKDKYLQCSKGIFPLGFFFTRGGVFTSNNEEILAGHIKGMIEKYVSAENKQKPYSDQKLTELLQGEGINISRRTVTKYRESLGIKNGRERKMF